MVTVHLSSDQVMRGQALAGDIVLCSWARHFPLTVPPSTQVYKCMLIWSCWLDFGLIYIFWTN